MAIAEEIHDGLAAAGAATVSREERREAMGAFGGRVPAPLSTASVAKFAIATGATRVVYGQFEIAGDPKTPASSLRIVVRVLDHARMRHGPEQEQLGALADVAALAGRVGWQTLATVAPGLAPSEEEYRRRRTPRPDALENHTRGLMAEQAAARHRYFAEAARLDADYAAPRFELGKMQAAAKDYRVAAGWLERVPAGDVRRREAAFLLGVCRYYLGDLAGALAAFEEVASATAAHEVINNVGVLQSQLDRPEAASSFHRALAADPVEPDYHFNVGYALWRRGDFEAAAESFRAVIDRRPDDQEAILFLGRCLKKSGPRSGDPRSEGRERLKESVDPGAWRGRR